MAKKRARASLGPKAEKAFRLFMRTVDFHDEVEERADQAWDAFVGRLRDTEDAAQWRSQLHPPLANHIIETTLAGLLDERLGFTIDAQPTSADPEEVTRHREGAELLKIAHRNQLSRDRFDHKARLFVHQGLVAPLSVAKTFYRRDTVEVEGSEVVDPGVADGLPEGALAAEERPVTRERVLFDGPTTEIVDCRDFFWDEAATELERATVVAHRLWMSEPELRSMEARGVYRNVDQLGEGPRTGAVGVSDREEDLESRSRTKDRFEVLEIWWREDDGRIWVVTVGNRTVELRPPEPNPFDHGRFPFTVLNVMPYLGTLTPISTVEKIDHLQLAAWDTMNQRHDNLRLINNLIVGFRDDVEDPNRFEFGPGKRWPGVGPEQVWTWQPNPIPAEISIGAETKLENMMQNVAGGQPFSTTAEASNLGADTATEAALVTSVAQATTKMMKQAVFRAYEEIGQLRTELVQQFAPESRLEQVVGADSEPEFRQVSREAIQGDFAFSTRPMTESLMRQERRAEANAKMQLFLQSAAIFSAMGVPLNPVAFLEDWLEQHDIHDLQRYLASAPQPGLQGAGGGPADQAQPGQQVPGSPGITNGQLAAGPTSPSNDLSVSPLAALQQQAALAGGLQGG